METSQAAPGTTQYVDVSEMATKANIIVQTLPPSSEQIEQEIEANVLYQGEKISEPSNTDSRKLALDWLLNDDGMQFGVLDPNLYQRYILALLAFSFGPSFRAAGMV